MNVDLIIPIFVPKKRVTYEEEVICDTHLAEPGRAVEGDCACGPPVYITRPTTNNEKIIEEIEAIQRRIVAYKERLQEFGVYNWEKVGEVIEQLRGEDERDD